MKKLFIVIVVILGLLGGNAQAQEGDSTAWEFGVDANVYFFPGPEQILLPVFRADRSWLHLEARYNYEDLKTTSAWVGYNFRGGDKVEYVITPMVGAAFGQTKGIGAGLEFTFSAGRWELYDESEYLFDSEDRANDFLYSWIDLTYSPRDWWWMGISAQRTKLYKTDLDIQRGFMLGASAKNWEFTGYMYNLGFDDPFLLFTVSLGF